MSKKVNKELAIRMYDAIKEDAKDIFTDDDINGYVFDMHGRPSDEPTIKVASEISKLIWNLAIDECFFFYAFKEEYFIKPDKGITAIEVEGINQLFIHRGNFTEILAAPARLERLEVFRKPDAFYFINTQFIESVSGHSKKGNSYIKIKIHE